MTESIYPAMSSSDKTTEKMHGTWTTSGNQRLLVFNDKLDSVTCVNHGSTMMYSRSIRQRRGHVLKERDKRLPFSELDQHFQPNVDVDQMSFFDTRLQNVGLWDYACPPLENYIITTPNGYNLDMGLTSQPDELGMSYVPSNHPIQEVTPIDQYETSFTEQNSDTAQLFTLKDISELIDNLQIHTHFVQYRLCKSDKIKKRLKRKRKLLRHKLLCKHSRKYSRKRWYVRKHASLSKVNNKSMKCRHMRNSGLTFKEKAIARARLSRRQPFLLY